MNFNSLPYELKENVCHHMTVSELTQYIQTHREAYNQCYPILKAKQIKLQVWAFVIVALLFRYASIHRPSGETVEFFIEYNKQQYEGDPNNIPALLDYAWKLDNIEVQSTITLKSLAEKYYKDEIVDYDYRGDNIDPEELALRVEHLDWRIPQVLSRVKSILEEDGSIEPETSGIELGDIFAPDYYRMLLTSLQPILDTLPDV